MSQPDPVDAKWSCDYCTYENWPSAQKCAMCHGTKPPQLIAEAAEREIRQERDAAREKERDLDIYAAASSPAMLICPTSSIGSTTKVTNQEDKNLLDKKKWTCKACTYLNQPKAVKCTACLAPRKKLALPPVTQGSEPNNDLLAAKAQSRTSTPLIPGSPEATKAANNDKNKAVYNSSRTVVKWSCSACTYENWPKSSKCVLCHTPRHRSPEQSPGNTSNIHDHDANNRRGSNYHRRSPPSSARSPTEANVEIELASASASAGNNQQEERRLRLIRNRMRQQDWLWLNACVGVVEGDPQPVQVFLSSGGDPARQLTYDECLLLDRPSAFDVGYTLVHLAIRFQREDLLAVLLTSTEVASHAVKRVPSHVSPDCAADIRREVAGGLRQRKGDFPCYFLTEMVTFALPAEVEDLPSAVQKQLYEEILDQDVQKELELESVINWNYEITDRLGSKLHALWNRTAGDCLLDSALQATWGVFDKDATLRRALADSLMECSTSFYARWKEYEAWQAQQLHFTLDESQWQQDWALLLSLASQPGAALEQTHIFTLAHILRRPIIVYGVKFFKSFRGETLGYARFQGVYLPLLWEPSFCWKSPISLGYTRGHFSALVPLEPESDDVGAGANLDTENSVQVCFLPLMDAEGKLLPVHFLTAQELGAEERLLKEWMDCCVTDGGILVAQQKINKRPPLINQMMDEWMDRYRKIAHRHQQLSDSDDDDDDE
ncbi:ZRANB1 [Branchiostoma lanceolatum]|uniref:ubiquitinyl hydrolase 1 n=1 Tax=Branchiostoma lanceolatum TaxID=7740 RepID=A0A8J9ZMD9_BRALA|nr:ZRANB1 [Branchiostoma lanceolatum]